MEELISNVSEGNVDLLHKQCSWYKINLSASGPGSRIGHTCTYIPGKDTTTDGSDSKSSVGKLYFIGGANPGCSFSDVYTLEFNPFSWEILIMGSFNARYEHSAFVSDSYPNKIFVFGGADSTRSKNDIQALDLDRDKWEDVIAGGEAPTSRTLHNSVCLRDKFVVFGGGGVGARAAEDDEVHIYDVVANSWNVLQTTSERPPIRLGHVMVAMDNKVYMHGGMNMMNMLDDLHVLNLENGSWSRPEVKGDVPRPRAYHGGFVVDSDIFIAGGLVGDEASDEVFQFNTETLTWRRRTDLALPRAALDFAICSFRESLGTKKIQSGLSVFSDEATEGAGEAPDNPSTFVVIHGGMNVAGDIFDDCFVLSLK